MEGDVHRRRTRALLRWYRTHGRSLPWRGDPDPWHVLVSEVMLQQTQVSRVIPAWHAFRAAFPNPAELAHSSLADAVQAWGDLGYQRRVRYLRETARIIVARGWPTTAAGLQDLPGVGEYTAAAVACFAFDEAVPAVDVNLRRVLSRWAGVSLTPAAARRSAREALGSPAGDWNQAMMDLGATLCRPIHPRCGECPVRDWCADPSVSLPSARQPTYAGSVRQARATIVKLLATKPAGVTEAELAEHAGHQTGTALRALLDEATIVHCGDHYLLAP